jgi:formylglycine-generating enzyme required for sulfatase activity
MNNKELLDRTLLKTCAKKLAAMGKSWFGGLAAGREYHDFRKAGFAGNVLVREILQVSRRAKALLAGLGLLVLVVLPGTAWMWQKGYNLEQAGLKITSVFVGIQIEPGMVAIPGGTFHQGDVEELGDSWRHPMRAVTMQPFSMGKYEVTFEEYDRFAIATGRDLPNDQKWGRGRRPVINVSWEEARDYADWLSRQTGQPYRLPTESEWEYAARSGKKQEAWAGTSDESQLGEYAVYIENSGNRTAEVGSKQPNAFAAHDLSGNVMEWVEDCLHGNYQGAPNDGSPWLEAHGGDCSLRVIRGGSWVSDPDNLRTSFRNWLTADARLNDLGFRLVQDTP